MTASDIVEKYIKFFENKDHTRVPNSPLIPENDPTTLFTSSGMQPLIPYLLGEPHPGGKRLVDVQNCFRAQDIDEVGDNRHTTFFRMLGNWSLGDYFKKEEIPWLWEFLTKELGLDKDRLYITVFDGDEKTNVPRDDEAFNIWKEIVPEEKIYFAGVSKNWWSRSGPPDNMPEGEIGGPDTEVYYEFDTPHGEECKGYDPVNCECGKFLEIANSVFIQYQKQKDGFLELPQKNVDHGAGAERLLAAVEDKSDIFQTSLFKPLVKTLEEISNKKYEENLESMRIIADHMTAAVFISSEKVYPSNKEQGYILRRLIRRAVDHMHKLDTNEYEKVIEKIIENNKATDPQLQTNFEFIKNNILEEAKKYEGALTEARKILSKKYGSADSSQDKNEIEAEDAFRLYTSHGLSPTQIQSLGYVFDKQKFSEIMEEHQKISKKGATKKFAGGLADTSEQTVRGHTATHLLHKAIRDLLGDEVHQTGSNITAERVRFDFNYDQNLTPEQLEDLEKTVQEKISENLPVHFEMLPLSTAKELGAIGLFDEKYQESVKVYFIGEDGDYYSKEFCGGPHVNFTSEVKSFKIIKQENLGRGQKRLYAKVG